MQIYCSLSTSDWLAITGLIFTIVLGLLSVGLAFWSIYLAKKSDKQQGQIEFFSRQNHYLSKGIVSKQEDITLLTSKNNDLISKVEDILNIFLKEIPKEKYSNFKKEIRNQFFFLSQEKFFDIYNFKYILDSTNHFQEWFLGRIDSELNSFSIILSQEEKQELNNIRDLCDQYVGDSIIKQIILLRSVIDWLSKNKLLNWEIMEKLLYLLINMGKIYSHINFAEENKKLLEEKYNNFSKKNLNYIYDFIKKNETFIISNQIDDFFNCFNEDKK